MTSRVAPIAIIAAAVLAPASVAAEDDFRDTACYDAQVVAKIVRQTPADLGDAGLWAWPYFLDLQVERVLAGRLRPGRLRILSVQHAWMAPGGDLHLRLRWNTDGGYNLVFPKKPLKRCAEGEPPMRAYISPRPGGTLDDLVAEGERRWGHWPPD